MTASVFPGGVSLSPGLSLQQISALSGLVISGVTYYPVLSVPTTNMPMIVVGGSGATYSQTGTTVTVTWTAHGMTASLNGASVNLTQSTGALLTGWFSNFSYVDANTFTCVSAVSQSTSGNLGSNTAKTTCLSLSIPANSLGPNGGVNFFASFVTKNSAGNKNLYFDFGSANVWTQSSGALDIQTAVASVRNSGSTGVNRAMTTPFGGGTGGTAVVPSRLTIDTTSAQTAVYAIQLAAATDWAGSWGTHTEYFYGA